MEQSVNIQIIRKPIKKRGGDRNKQDKRPAKSAEDLDAEMEVCNRSLRYS